MLTTILVTLAFICGLAVGSVGVWRMISLQRRMSDDMFDAEALLESSREARSARVAMRKERIMEAAVAMGKITNNGVEDLFCISDRTASAYLRQLTKEGKLERQGSGRGTFYIPVQTNKTSK